jgi:hypothetical protein
MGSGTAGPAEAGLPDSIALARHHSPPEIRIYAPAA